MNSPTVCVSYLRTIVRGMALFAVAALLVGAATGAAGSCSRLPCHQHSDSLSRLENVTPVTPATLEETESEDEGGDTPPANILANLGYHGPEIEPWRELEYVLGRLWDDGREFTVYMIVHYLRLINDERLNDPVAQVALSMARIYENGTTRISPPAWWSAWVDDLLLRWRRCMREARRQEGEVTELMQRGPALSSRRPELWLRYMEQLSEYPDAVRAVVFRGLAGWLRESRRIRATTFCTGRHATRCGFRPRHHLPGMHGR